MVHVVALNCPNCGSNLSRRETKCRYCGAELVLLPDGSSLRFRSEITCPKCGAVNEKSSWFCLSCNTILTQDIEMLKENKKKISFEQGRAKDFMPSWMKEKLEPGEYLYFVFRFTDNDFYAATDKRLIKSRFGNYGEARLTDVVSIGPTQFKTSMGFFSPSVKGGFEVHTFNGSMVFDGFDSQDATSLGTFYAWVNKALENHNIRRKDPRKIMLELPLGEEETHGI